jgi:hypothetical protein
MPLPPPVLPSTGGDHDSRFQPFMDLLDQESHNL